MLCQAWCWLPGAITKAGWCRPGLGSGTFQGWNYIGSLEGSPKHNIPSPPTGLGLAMRSGLGPVSHDCVGVIPALGPAPHGILGESGEGFSPSCVLVWGFVMISWQGISVRNQRQEQKKKEKAKTKEKNPNPLNFCQQNGMFPFLFWLLAAPNCSQWKKISMWKHCWPPPAVQWPGWSSCPAAVLCWGDKEHGPSRACHRAPFPALFGEDIAMRTGLLFCGEHRDRAGERLQGHRWHAALTLPTCPCSRSLSPPQLAAEPCSAPACAVPCHPPSGHCLPSWHHPASPCFASPVLGDPLWGCDAVDAGERRSSHCNA